MASLWTSSGDFAARENKIKMCRKRLAGERGSDVAVENICCVCPQPLFPPSMASWFSFPGICSSLSPSSLIEGVHPHTFSPGDGPCVLPSGREPVCEFVDALLECDI